MTAGPALSAAAFIAGTILGSFYYTLAVRLAGGMFSEGPLRGLVSPSSCPSCGGNIRAIDMIPIIGFIIRRGRCRACGAPVSHFYLYSEIVFGLIAMLTLAYMGAAIVSISAFLVMGTGIAIAVVDARTMKIPLPLVALTLLLAIDAVRGVSGFADTAGGFLLMFLFFGTILLLFPGSFGGGDLWYASALGLLFGLELSVVLLEISLLSGAIFGTAYAIITKKGFRTRIPFAPFLTLGMIGAYLFGRRILFVYYDVFF